MSFFRNVSCSTLMYTLKLADDVINELLQASPPPLRDVIGPRSLQTVTSRESRVDLGIYHLRPKSLASSSTQYVQRAADRPAKQTKL